MPQMAALTHPYVISLVDVVARWLATVGLVVAIASLLLTWRLWKRSGAELTASLTGLYLKGNKYNRTLDKIVFKIDIVNRGRMAAMIHGATVIYMNTRWRGGPWLNW